MCTIFLSGWDFLDFLSDTCCTKTPVFQPISYCMFLPPCWFRLSITPRFILLRLIQLQLFTILRHHAWAGCYFDSSPAIKSLTRWQHRKLMRQRFNSPRCFYHSACECFLFFTGTESHVCITCGFFCYCHENSLFSYKTSWSILLHL